MSRDWDAATYHRVSNAHVEWARVLLDRLDLHGHETVLDAGCGSGRTTLMLLERLPDGHVVAVDQAPSMVEHARNALAVSEEIVGAPPAEPAASARRRATVLQGDLMELELADPVDAAFSNAVFHWIPDHDRLFARLHAALLPTGRLVAQCGGKGNVEDFHEAARAVGAQPPYAEHLAGWDGPWNFAGPEETSARLEAAGFREVQSWLEPSPVVPDDPTDYLRTVCLGHHLEQLPEGLRDGYVRAVSERSGDQLDYVRLNISARA